MRDIPQYAVDFPDEHDHTRSWHKNEKLSVMIFDGGKRIVVVIDTRGHSQDVFFNA